MILPRAHVQGKAASDPMARQLLDALTGAAMPPPPHRGIVPSGTAAAPDERLSELLMSLMQTPGGGAAAGMPVSVPAALPVPMPPMAVPPTQLHAPAATQPYASLWSAPLHGAAAPVHGVADAAVPRDAAMTTGAPNGCNVAAHPARAADQPAAKRARVAGPLSAARSGAMPLQRARAGDGASVPAVGLASALAADTPADVQAGTGALNDAQRRFVAAQVQELMVRLGLSMEQAQDALAHLLPHA